MLLEGQQQAADQRVAHDEARAAPLAQAIDAVATDDARGMPEGGPGFAQVEQVADIGAVDHHATEQREFRDRRADAVDVGAELPAVEGHRLQRSPAQGRALDIGFIIGMRRVGPEMYVGPALERGDRLGAGAQEGVAQAGRGAVADDAVEEAGGLLDAVAGRDLLRMQRVRHPGRRGGERAGSADMVRALDHQDGAPLDRGEDRGGQPGGARADDDEIVFRLLRHILQGREH